MSFCRQLHECRKGYVDGLMRSLTDCSDAGIPDAARNLWLNDGHCLTSWARLR